MTIKFNDLEVSREASTTALEEPLPAKCNSLHMIHGIGDARPHVLFVIDQLSEMGGAERILCKIVRLLPQDLFRCSILTFKVNSEAEEIKRISCPLHVLPLGKTYNWNALRVARQIRALVRKEKTAIVHTFFETSDLWAGPIAKFSGRPVLISSRRDLGILRSLKHRIGYRLLGRLYDTVLAVSPQVRQFCLENDGLDPAKVQTLFNGVEMERVSEAANRLAMRRKMGISERTPVIITVGNIRRVKGIDLLVEAAQIVCRKHPEALFVVVGREAEPEYCRDLHARISSLALDRNFRFLGSCEDVFSLLLMSDVFCLPSRTEGFSNALIEAMACKLPCVATDVGGNREVLRHGETGFIVGQEDWKAMAEGIVSLLDDPGLGIDMGSRGEEIVHSRFTIQVMIEELVRVYQKLLAAREH